MSHFLSFNKISEPEETSCTLDNRSKMKSRDSYAMKICLPYFSDYKPASQSGVSIEKNVSDILKIQQGMFRRIFEGASLMGWHQSAGQLSEKFTAEAHEAGPQKGKITFVTHSNSRAEWTDLYMPPCKFPYYGHGKEDLGLDLQIRTIDMPETLLFELSIFAYSLHSIIDFFFRKGHECHRQFMAKTESKDE